MKTKNYWNTQTIVNEFKQYKTPNEAKTKAYGAWKAMKRLLATNPNIEALALSHMTKKTHWNKVELESVIKNYSSMKEVREKNSALYHYLWRLNQTESLYIKSITIHFKEPLPDSITTVKTNTLLFKHILKETYKTQYNISTSLSVQINFPTTLYELDNHLIPKLKAYGELVNLGGYNLEASIKEDSTKQRTHSILIKLNLQLNIFSHAVMNQSSLNNLLIQPYIEWLQLEIPSILDDIKNKKHITKNTYGINDELIDKFINDPNFKVLEDGTLLKLNDSECRYLPYKLKAQDGTIRIKYNGVNLVLTRIIFAKFNTKLDPSKMVFHKDGNKENNHSNNLIQLSASESMKMQFITKRRKAVKGNSKLSLKQVEQVRSWRNSGMNYKQILDQCLKAKIPLSGKGHLSNIINNKTWNTNEN